MPTPRTADRKIVIITIFLFVGVVYFVRLFYLQVIDKSYKYSAKNNVLRYVPQFPPRGLIYDRNGKLIVYNEVVYDLMVIPKQVKDVDTNELCRLLDITVEGFTERMKRANLTRDLASLFEKQLSKETYGYIEEKLYRFNGFFVIPRTLRKYPDAAAAHLLGYVGEVSPNEIKKDQYYRQGDYIGKSGLELSYEKDLRGIKGLRIRMVDVRNRDVGSFRNGEFDTVAIKGNDLYTGLDIELQKYGEELLQNKRGSVVAIDPSTGEILCFVSSPAYDPNLLVGRVRSENFQRLNADPVKPLINRAISGQYPPGSTFKMANDMIGLQEGVITPETKFSCAGVVSTPIKCTHSHQSPLNVYTAIEQSCNPFHFQVFRAIMNDPKFHNIHERYDNWRNHLISMGFGQKLGTDLAYEVNGKLFPSSYYDKVYGIWNTMTIRSLSIGQGEFTATPLQMANYVAMVANDGWYYTPHVVRAIDNEKNSTHFTKKKNVVNINPEHIAVVRDGMEGVMIRGTARGSKIDSISMAGKTGTAQNPHGKDHAVFVGYAPVENPKIAICVIVENAGFGGTWAAPIASLMIEKYMKHRVTRPDLEKRMKEANFLKN